MPAPGNAPATRTSIVQRKLRLRTAIVMPFVLLIAATVGLVGWLSFRNGQSAVQRLARQVHVEVASRIQEVLADYIKRPHQITRSNINALRLNQINLQNKQALEQRFAYQLGIFPEVSEIYVGTPDGSIIFVGRTPDGGLVANTTSSFPKREYYKLDNEGKRRQFVKATDYDPRIRPWYTLATAKRGQVWTDVYQLATLGTLGIAAAEPYYDEQGNLVAVFTTNLPLKRISEFLHNLKISPTKQVFIMDRAGSLVATSTKENLFVVTGQDGMQQLKAVDSQNLAIGRTAKYLQERFGDLSKIQGLQELSFNIDGKRQYAVVQPYSDGKGLEFLVVVVVPEADFIEQINANSRTTILLCLLALGLAFTFGIINVRWIIRPILRVAQASDEIAQGNLDQQVEPSRIIEIETLANSFNSMASQLKESFETLEAKNEALRLAEENYRSIFENSLEGIFQSTPEGHYISVNPAMANIYGYDSPEEMIASVTEISRQIFVDRGCLDEFQSLMEQQGKVTNFEYQVYRKDGSIIWVEEDTHAVRDSSGKLLYYEGLVQDITQRKRESEDLKRQLQELRIEIDQHHRLSEVAVITQSDYFQEIQSEVENIQLDQFWS